jgi:hypothetical protein
VAQPFQGTVTVCLFQQQPVAVGRGPTPHMALLTNGRAAPVTRSRPRAEAAARAEAHVSFKSIQK